MNALTRAVAVLCLGVGSSASMLWAADSLDELRQNADQLRQKAKELYTAGQKEEAIKAEREAHGLLEKLERAQKERGEAGRKENTTAELPARLEKQQDQLRRLREEFEHKKAAGAPDEELVRFKEYIGKAERELQTIQMRAKETAAAGKDSTGPGAQLAEAAQRVQHLRVAAENLKAAGAGDLAAQVMKQAESMEQEVRKAKEMLSAQMSQRKEGSPAPELQGQIGELRREVERLRAEVQELRTQVRK